MATLAKIGVEVGMRAIPLCATYLVVLFETTALGALKRGVGQLRTVRWAYGTLPDGQCEVLGIWPGRATVPDRWQDAFSDLKERGVQRVLFVGGDESIDVSIAFPSATFLPFVGLASRQGPCVPSERDCSIAFVESCCPPAAAAMATTRTQSAVLADTSKRPNRSERLEAWHTQLDRLSPFFGLSPRRQRVIGLADAEVHRLHRMLARIAIRDADLLDEEALAGIVGRALSRDERKREKRDSSLTWGFRDPFRGRDALRSAQRV